MIDVRLITLIPPAPAIGQPASVQAPTTNGANILSQIPTGSILSGFIINRDATGNPILRTETGDVLFASNFFLKIGSEVVIRVQNSAGQQHAHIVSVNGLPPEVAAVQSGFDETPDVIGGRTPSQPSVTQTTPQIPPPPAGSNLSTIVVVPPPSSSAPLQPGTGLLLTVLGTSQPQQVITQLIPEAEQSLPTPATNALSSLLPTAPLEETPLTTPPATAPNFPTPPAPSTNVINNTLPITLSNQAATIAQLSGPLGQTLVVTTLAHYENDITTLTSPLGILRTAYLGGLQQGDQISVRVSSVTHSTPYNIALASATPAAPLAPITELAHSWTSLSQIVQLLQESGVVLPVTGLPSIPIVPEGRTPPAATVGNQLMFFISALKGGDFKGWIGTNHIKALEDKGYGSLIRKAEGEFMLLARQFVDVPAHQWQSLFFPIAVHGEVQQVRAFIKREKKKDEQGKTSGDEDTRFVVEMSLSQLGEMQMDGLVKRRNNHLQFDLVIRSLDALPTSFEQDILAIYTNTAELTGFRGQLIFQAVHQFPIHPFEDIAPHIDDVVV